LAAGAVRKRVRRDRDEGERLRERLLNAAWALFTTNGYESVSIRKIAERAGCPTMTFYGYFKSKRALLRHLWDGVFAELEAYATAAANTEQGPPERLAAFVRGMIDFWLEHPDSYRLVFMNQDVEEADDDGFYVVQFDVRKRFALMESLIEMGKADQTFRRIDTEVLSQVLVTTTIGIVHALVTIPEAPWRRQELIATSIDLLLRGVSR
jgi:AcrR family transcriptional regulator